MRFRLMAGTVFSTAAFASFAAAAYAQEAPAQPIRLASLEDDQFREKVTITATRTEKQVDEVPVTVTVIGDETIENELATDIKDLVRFEPGVSVRNSPSRFGAALGTTGRDGNAGFNIRGLEGNRVLIQVDGVRVADSYTFGAQSQGRGDYVDLDLLKSVEILRGPASALYGSDGVAGAVSFVTRDPSDLIKDGRAFGLRARSAFSSADESWANSIIGATEVGDWSAMLAYTRRDGQEQENRGENVELNSRRTAPNPTDYGTDSYLGKIVWTPSDAQRFRFTYDRLDRDATYEVYSGRAVPLPVPPNPQPYAATGVIDLDAVDTSWRERFALDHAIEFGDGFFRSAQWSLYSQASKTRQFTDEDRFTAADRIRDTTFDNKVWGLNSQFDGGFVTGPVDHHWTAGVDFSSLTQSSIRTGTVPPVGEAFPARPFPTTDYELTGVFLQDEISFLDGQLVFYPAVRYDAYELTPQRDALYPSSQPATPSDGSHVSPKLGIVAWPSDWLGAFFNYAAGYKAPAPSQVNNGFFNPLQNYTSIASPDLEPETSDSIEVGVRTRHLDFLGGEWSGSLTGFAAEYENFIEQVQLSGSFTPLDPAIFQFVNLTAVEISGLEGKIDGQWDNGLGFIASAALSDGDIKDGGNRIPLASVDPLKAVLGLTYADPDGRFGGQVIATYSDAKKNDDIFENQRGNASADLFSPRSFVILDITAYWNITDWVALRAGAFNVTDEKYWWWGDVRGLSNTSIVKDAYTQPGANYSVSLTVKY
ncbi:MAG: TonB-dependent hemoglobin/transferrin/lactoferrin family receptor [Hyphomonadaceae bacterium]|nr:TonB-dependent hemoglobin/transferrin/lactoferrin family receptor [Hyphomonadaceae bacterium]